MELTLLMGPITAMHLCLMAQMVVVMLEDVEVRILNVGITQGDFLKGYCQLYGCTLICCLGLLKVR